MRGIHGVLLGAALLGIGYFVGIAWSAAPPPATQPAARKQELTVIDGKAKQPVSGAEVTLQTQGGRKDQAKQTTDDAGVVRVDLPEKPPPFFYLIAKKAGYVPMRVGWQNARGRSDPIPDQYVLELP